MTTQRRAAMHSQKTEVIDGVTVKYHANGTTVFARGKQGEDGEPEGYWEWFRPDGTLKRSGSFEAGVPVGEWTTYDQQGKVYKVTKRKGGSA